LTAALLPFMNGRPSKSHHVFSPERIAFVNAHLATAKQFPRKVAEMMREAGLYSPTTYLGDIEGAVRKIAGADNNWSMAKKSNRTVLGTLAEAEARREKELTLPPPMCLHTSIRYDADKDNYYCNECHAGMGLKDFLGKGLPDIQRLRKGRESLCEAKVGIGLCDDCGQPKRPQKSDGYGHMICADCDEKYGVINAFRNWLRMFDERNRDVILEWLATPEAFPEVVKILSDKKL
jgi:hypothetical protein